MWTGFLQRRRNRQVRQALESHDVIWFGHEARGEAEKGHVELGIYPVERASGAVVAEGAGVPAGPINTVAEALSDPQIIARDLLIHPEGMAGLRSPLVFSRSPLAVERAAPALDSGSRES